MAEESPVSFSGWRRWSIGFNVVVSTLALLAILVMVNYLALQFSWRFSLGESANPRLTPLTQRVITSLTNTVSLIVFFDRTEGLFGPVRELAKEYEARSPRIKVEFIDYRMPGRAEMIREKYKLVSGLDSSRVIFDCNGRYKTILASELSEFDISDPREIKRTAFKGEQLFTSALVSVTDPKQLKAYFTQGHGEHDPASTGDRAMSKFAQLLTENNIDVQSLAPFNGIEIPSDCQLLIIAGAEKTFTSVELDKIQQYLTRGGRLLVLFPWDLRRTGLERLLGDWNVEVGLNQVRDSVQAQAGDSQTLVASQFANHPVTRPLQRSSLNMVIPRSIGQRLQGKLAADAPKVTELVFTGLGGEVVGRIENGRGEIERKGAISLAVAVERGGIQGVNANLGSSRLVVVGNSLFLSNVLFDGGANRDFAHLAVNWLLSRDLLLGDVPPRAIPRYRVNVTEHQLQRLRLIFLVIVPGAVLLLGLLVWIRRRS